MRQFTGMVALTGALAVGLAALTQTPALAQKYPERPVKIVLPFGAGGVADVTTRLVAPDCQPPAPPTQALLARALGLDDWDSVLAHLDRARQDVRECWASVSGDAK